MCHQSERARPSGEICCAQRRGGRTPDITHLAIALIERRLKDAFSAIKYAVHGVPKDAAGAEPLAAKDKHGFQKWIIGAIEGQPYKGGKKGMDRGDLSVAES